MVGCLGYLIIGGERNRDLRRIGKGLKGMESASIMQIVADC